MGGRWRQSKAQRENVEGDLRERQSVQRKLDTVSKRKSNKKVRERGKQPSDEMPVMSAQVLMSATALVDTLPGNKPMT